MKGNNTKVDLTTGTLTVAAISLFAGYVLGANQSRIKAFFGYHFPHTFVLGNKQKRRDGVEPNAEELLQIADEIIQASRRGKPAGSCLIANVDPTGTPRVRPINPMKVNLRFGNDDNDDGNNMNDTESSSPKAIFFTNKRTRKYKQFQNDNRAELVYFEPMGISSVRLVGSVHELSHDDAITMWSPRLSGFIQEGPEDANTTRFTSFEFIFHRIEVVSMKHGLATTERMDWGPYTLIRDKDKREWIYQKTTEEQRFDV